MRDLHQAHRKRDPDRDAPYDLVVRNLMMPQEIGDYVKTVTHAMPKQMSKFSCNTRSSRRQPEDDETNLI